MIPSLRRWMDFDGGGGKLAAATADMVAIEPKEVKVLRTWVAGREADPAG